MNGKNEYKTQRDALLYFDKREIDIVSFIEDTAKKYRKELRKINNEYEMKNFAERMGSDTLNDLFEYIPEGELKIDDKLKFCAISGLVFKCMIYGEGSKIMGVYEVMQLERDMIEKLTYER